MTERPHDDVVALADRVRALATAFQGSRVLLSAFELDVFTAIQDEEKTAPEVAEAIGGDARATERLLNALVALGLLDKRDGRFANTSGGARLLVRGRPDYMANLAHTNHLWDTWSRLSDVVRTGRPAERRDIGYREQEWQRAFIAAMHWRARQSAPGIVNRIDLNGVSRVLDVGGGSGAFSMAFVRARAGISATVFDLPEIVPLTRNYLRTEGFESRIDALPGDYTTDPLPGGFDLVFLSAIVHSNGFAENQRLIQKAASALNPGGRVVVVDWVMSDDRTQPLVGALFAINMLVGTAEGDTFTEAEIRQWLAGAGLVGITRADTPLGTSILTGRRP